MMIKDIHLPAYYHKIKPIVARIDKDRARIRGKGKMGREGGGLIYTVPLTPPSAEKAGVPHTQIAVENSQSMP